MAIRELECQFYQQTRDYYRDKLFEHDGFDHCWPMPLGRSTSFAKIIAPSKRDRSPSCRSMRRTSFHFTMRSLRANEPTLSWPALVATARWAMKACHAQYGSLGEIRHPDDGTD